MAQSKHMNNTENGKSYTISQLTIILRYRIFTIWLNFLRQTI